VFLRGVKSSPQHRRHQVSDAERAGEVTVAAATTSVARIEADAIRDGTSMLVQVQPLGGPVNSGRTGPAEPPGRFPGSVAGGRASAAALIEILVGGGDGEHLGAASVGTTFTNVPPRTTRRSPSRCVPGRISPRSPESGRDLADRRDASAVRGVRGLRRRTAEMPTAGHEMPRSWLARHQHVPLPPRFGLDQPADVGLPISSSPTNTKVTGSRGRARAQAAAQGVGRHERPPFMS